MNSLAVIVFIIILSMIDLVRAMQFVCNGEDVVVVVDEENDLRAVCDAVEIGKPFLASIDLQIPTGITINISKNLPPNCHNNSIGCYDQHNNEISVLTFESALNASVRLPSGFGILMNKPIWKSYVIHELAHASFVNKFSKGLSMFAASEYISSVVQLKTLPEIERDKILGNYTELSGFDYPREITMTYYAIDPGKFAVNAYLHYSKPENGPQFIKKLLREGLPDESE